MAESILHSPKVFAFRRDFFIASKLHVESVIKTGLHGDIVLACIAQHKDTKFIVKKFSLLNEEKLERTTTTFNNEVKFMQSLDHPFLAKCYYAATCTEYAGICMKYYSRGTLNRYVGNMDLDMAELCVIQVACALRYLHKNKLVHLDVKLSNVFLEENFDAVLGDFGMSVEMQPPRQTLARRYIGGTPGYHAPEWKAAARDLELDPYKMDSYGLGVVLWCLVFERKAEDTVNYYYETRKRQDLRPNIKNMLLRLLQQNPAKRVTITDFLTRVRRDSVARPVIDRN